MNLAATMTLNSGGFMNPLNAARSGMEAFRGAAAKVTGALSLIGLSFAAFKSAQGFTDALKGVFESGKELRTLSMITGQSITDLITLRRVFKEAGISADSLPHNLILLQKSLGGINEEGEPTAYVFRQLGLSIDNLKKLSAPEQLEQIGAAISKLPTQSERAATAMKIFGRGGAEMLAVLSDPKAIESAKTSLGSYAALMERDSALFTKITNSLEILSTKVKGFFVGFADKVAPGLDSLLDKIKGINLTGLGQQIGSLFAVVSEAFKGGSFTEIISLSLEVAGMKFVNLLSGGIIGIGRAIGTTLGTVMAGIVNDVPTFLAALNLGLRGAVQGMGALMLSVLEKPIAAIQAGMEYAAQSMIETLSKIPGIGKLFGIQGFHAQSFDEIMEDHQRGNLFGLNKEQLEASSANNTEAAKTMLQGLYSGFSVKGFVNDLKADIEAAMKEGKTFDSSSFENKLETLLGQAEMAAEKTAAALEQQQPRNGTGGDTKTHGTFEGLKEGDRLAKIGGFIGSGGPAGEHARKTADNTGKMVTKMDQWIDIFKITSGKDAPSATWGY